MKKMHILVIFVMLFFLFACDTRSLNDVEYEISSVEFGTENHQILIQVVDKSDLVNHDTVLALKIYTSSALIESSLLYTIDTFTLTGNTLTFVVLFEEQVNYLEDLYICISESKDEHPKTSLHKINLYELANTSSSEFAAHIKNVIDGLTISSLNVLVNFSNYTITNCEYSISCDITTDYNKVTITIHLGHVVIGNNFKVNVNGIASSFTYDSTEKTISIIMDDPNWTQPY